MTSCSGGQASVLASVVLREGVHRLTFAVQGDAVVGVATAADEQARKPGAFGGKAWGVGTATGCLHHASTATKEGMYGVELIPQRLEDDAVERLLHFEVDMDERSMRMRCAPDPWREVPLRLPTAVRPWALMPGADEPHDVPSTVRLVSCVAEPVALHLVHGLDHIVGELGAGAQKRALAWCAEEDVYDVAAIHATGSSLDFLSAIRCRQNEVAGVLKRLAAVAWP